MGPKPTSFVDLLHPASWLFEANNGLSHEGALTARPVRGYIKVSDWNRKHGTYRRCAIFLSCNEGILFPLG